MTERSRQAYLSIAGVLLAVGGTGLAIGLVDGAFSLGLFRGSPVLTSVFVLAIGAALRWTALSAPAGPEAESGRPSARDHDDDGGDAPPERETERDTPPSA